MAKYLEIHHHKLKLIDPYWDDVKRGVKTFEIRVNDRGFQTGDLVTFLHYDPNDSFGSPSYISKYDVNSYDVEDADTMLYKISYILPLTTVGIMDTNYVVFGIIPVKEESD